MCFRPPSFDDMMKKCPACGAFNAPELTTCKKCGTELPAAADPANLPPAAAPKGPGAPAMAPKGPGAPPLTPKGPGAPKPPTP